MLLLSILFDTDVFFLKVICIVRLKNNFNEQQCIFLVELLGDKLLSRQVIVHATKVN